jgi:tight adherence protein C
MWTSSLLACALRAIVLLTFALVLFVCVWPLARVPALAAPAYGLRGKRRSEARNGALFRASEGVIAQLGAWLIALPLTRTRRWLRVLLRHASEPAGFCADELLALSLLSLVCLGSAAAWLLYDAELGCEPAFASFAFAAWLPIGRVSRAGKQRAVALERSLPAAMDLCVLCMGAGADFPAALAFVIEELGPTHAVCREELSQLLDELALGRTRLEALSALSERSRSRAVRELVVALCQSEEKGTPMIEALTIQSSTLRQRRSVRAEELAAQAGVKMMLPLMLLVASLLLVVFGPIIVTGTGL